MKILHYLLGIPPLRGGGLVIYAIDLAKMQQKQGNKVAILTMGSFGILDKNTKIQKAPNYNGLIRYKIKNPLPCPMSNGISQPEYFLEHYKKKDFLKFFSDNKFDVFHVHSLIGLPPSVLEAAKLAGTKVVFTTHDYYGICCKPEKTDINGNVCENCNFNNCSSCGKYAFSYSRMRIEQSNLFVFAMRFRFFRAILNYLMEIRAKRREKMSQINRKKENNQHQETDCILKANQFTELEKQYRHMFGMMDCFHYNSLLAKDVYEKVLGKQTNIVLPVSTSKIKDNREIRDRIDEKKQIIHVGFLGGAIKTKGLDFLIKVLDEINCCSDKVMLHIYGLNLYQDRRYIVKHKKFEQQDIENIYSQFDILVVPSLWKETFSLVTLEALSFGMPCLISSSVGAKEIVKKVCEDFIFYDANDLKMKLIKYIDSPNKIVEDSYKVKRAKIDFDFENHCKKIERELYGTYLC